ncbi:MAG: DUF2029 domain-containing protein [Candidatus Sumerlaeia bacterium]|nr:DUF2029 domain-containing protein [Candidatus Sumerlaeia bacterium]
MSKKKGETTVAANDAGRAAEPHSTAAPDSTRCEPSPTVWLLGGFLLLYVPFLLVPVFFNKEHVMGEVCPVARVTYVGMDLGEILQFSRAWAVEHKSPYILTNTYPPLETLFFVPFLYVSFPVAYYLLTLASTGCFLLITWLLPVLAEPRRALTAPTVFFVTTGLFSHGLLFELERGQFNLIAMALCWSGVYLFHVHRRLRIPACVLFSLSVQLKVYPAIFVLLLVDNWRDWKANLRRLGLIAAGNFLCLFVLGLGPFVEFVSRTVKKVSDPPIWPGNHSIHSYATLTGEWLGVPAWVISAPLLAATLGLLAALVVLAYVRRREGFHPHLLVGCTAAALLIPSLSNDYTLSFLPAALALYFSCTKPPAAAKDNPARALYWNIWIVLIALAYASTVFSVFHKVSVCRVPLLFMATPALVLILAAATALFVMEGKRAANPNS